MSTPTSRDLPGRATPRRDGTRRRVSLIEIRAQHSNVRASFDSLVVALDEVADQPLDPRAQAEALLLLERLRTDLQEHFAFEERGGYLAEESYSAPHAAPQIVELLREHGQFSAQLTRLAERAHGARRAPERWHSLRIAIRALAAAVQEHELAENRLVQQVMTEDHGGGG